MEDEGLAREIGAKAAEKLLPIMAFIQAGPVGAITANIIIISTLLIMRIRGSRVKSLEEAEAQDLARLAELSRAIDDRRAELERLRGQLSQAGERERRVIEEAIRAEEAALESLLEEYELTQLRILAIRRLWSLRDEKLRRQVEKLIKDIQEGRLKGKQYEAAKLVESMWEKRQIEIATLRSILERG